MQDRDFSTTALRASLSPTTPQHIRPDNLPSAKTEHLWHMGRAHVAKTYDLWRVCGAKRELSAHLWQKRASCDAWDVPQVRESCQPSTPDGTQTRDSWRSGRLDGPQTRGSCQPGASSRPSSPLPSSRPCGPRWGRWRRRGWPSRCWRGMRGRWSHCTQCR